MPCTVHWLDHTTRTASLRLTIQDALQVYPHVQRVLEESGGCHGRKEAYFAGISEKP